MSYNANEHDRSGRCVRHPEVKLRKRKLFLPGTKYVFKWSKRIQYCPCCVMEFVLAVDPEVKGQVGLSRKGRLEIINITPEGKPNTSTSVASMPSLKHIDNIIIPDDSDNISHISDDGDNSSHAAGSSASRESRTRRQLHYTHKKVESTPFGRKYDQAAEEDHSQSIRKSEEIHKIHEDNSYEHQPPQQQLKSSPADVRDLQKHLKPDLHQEYSTYSTKPPVDDVFVCKDLMGSASLYSTSDIDVLFGLEAVPARIGSEIEKGQAWNSSLDSWQKEKDEMTAVMNDLKKENKQLQISMKCMKKWQNKPSSHEYQNLVLANGSLSDSQESYKEIIHQQGSVIQSLRDEIKFVSTDQMKRMQEVVSLLQQQVKTLEEEKEINRVKHEQEIDVLQQEIQSLEQRHTETVCRMVKMAMEHEKQNNRALLDKFEEIEHARRLQIAQKGERGMKEEHSNPEAELNVEMTKEEVLELNKNYFSLKSELDELKTKLADNERRKEKRKTKKKKSKEKQRGRRKTMNDMPFPIDELLCRPFVQLGFDDKEPELDDSNELMNKS